MAKKRSDRNSVTIEVAQFQSAAAGLPAWPSTVERADDQPEIDAIYNQIVSNRSMDAWTGVDLIRAAQLAQLMHLVSTDTNRLVRTGTMIRNQAGKPVPNPLLHGLEKLNSQVNHLCRSLGLTIQTNGNGDPRDQMAANGQFYRDHGRVLANGSASGVDAGPAKLPSAIAHLVGGKGEPDVSTD